MNGVRRIQAGGRFAVHEIDAGTDMGGRYAGPRKTRKTRKRETPAGRILPTNHSNWNESLQPSPFVPIRVIRWPPQPSGFRRMLMCFVDCEAPFGSSEPQVVDQPRATEENGAGQDR